MGPAGKVDVMIANMGNKPGPSSLRICRGTQQITQNFVMLGIKA
jgi:hypothetical protein